MRRISCPLLLLVAVLSTACNVLRAQDLAVTNTVTTTTETKAEEPVPMATTTTKKEKAAKGVDKVLQYVGYLNFTDRTIDRMRSGMTAYEPYKGKIIRRVDIEIVKPFGTSLDEPTKSETNRGQRFANGLQVTTREWVVGNELLFHEGDSLMPVLIAESERNLWNRDNFKDVRLEVRVVREDTSMVDVIVYVRDRFSWSPYFKAQYNQIKAGVEFKNFMGIPQSLLLYAGPVYRKDNPYSIYVAYKYNNIANTHIDASVSAVYEKLNKGQSMIVSKPFFSPFNKWAWSIKSDMYKQAAKIPGAFAQAIPSNVMYTTQDAWIAHSSPFSPRNEKTDLRRIVVAWHFNSYHYMDRPFLHNEDYSQHYNSNWYLMSALGVANWDYYLDRNIYSLGEAEYFAKGWNSAVVYGLQHDEELGGRFCAGLRINNGKYFKNVGYFFTQFSGTGFLTTEGLQSVRAMLQTNYFSAPIKMRKYFMRQFVKTKVNLGFFQPESQELIVNSESGDLRGFYYNTLQGNRSYSFSYQVNVYPPFKVLGFSSSVFAYADLAWVGQGTWSSYRAAQSIGIGLRLRNLGLGIDYFEISFAYMPSSSNMPGQKPYNVVTDMQRRVGIGRNDLFSPGVVSPLQ